MIIVYRNFFRNKMVNLSLKSIRHFLPTARVVCVSFYKESPNEYLDQEPLDESIEQYFFKTAYVNKGGIPDHIDSTKTSGFQNPDNGKYFVEGYNAVYNIFKDTSEKVLMLSEDHFFTTNATLNELLISDYDVAYAPWDESLDANGSILCIRFNELPPGIFPLPEANRSVEIYLKDTLITKVAPERRFKLFHRQHADYKGDGMYTNSSEQMKECLVKAGIL